MELYPETVDMSTLLLVVTDGSKYIEKSLVAILNIYQPHISLSGGVNGLVGLDDPIPGKLNPPALELTVVLDPLGLFE
jgi:hypothetical protein